MIAQILIQVIILTCRMFSEHSKTYFEYFNEFILMMVLYTVICFSPFAPNVDVKCYSGYVSITFVAIHLAVNLISIFTGNFFEQKLKCKKRIILRNYHKSRLASSETVKANNLGMKQRMRE